MKQNRRGKHVPSFTGRLNYVKRKICIRMVPFAGEEWLENAG